MSEESRELAVKPAQELSVDDVLTQLRKVQELMKRAMVEGEDYGVIPGTRKPTLLKPGAEKLLLMMRLDPQYQAVTERIEDDIFVTSVCILYKVTPDGPERRGSGMGACDSTEPSKRTAPFNTILKIANKRALVAAVLNVTGASQIFTQDIEDGGEGAVSRSAGGRGGRRARAGGTGGAPPPVPVALSPDDPSTIEQRNAFWRTAARKLGETDATNWLKTQLEGFGYSTSKELKCGQLTLLYERLQALAAAREPSAPEPVRSMGTRNEPDNYVDKDPIIAEEEHGQ